MSGWEVSIGKTSVQVHQWASGVEGLHDAWGHDCGRHDYPGAELYEERNRWTGWQDEADEEGESGKRPEIKSDESKNGIEYRINRRPRTLARKYHGYAFEFERKEESRKSSVRARWSILFVLWRYCLVIGRRCTGACRRTWTACRCCLRVRTCWCGAGQERPADEGQRELLCSIEGIIQEKSIKQVLERRMSFKIN